MVPPIHKVGYPKHTQKSKDNVSESGKHRGMVVRAYTSYPTPI